MKKEFEAVIIGLGPAGLAAAATIAECGARTAVIQDSRAPGGQIYRQIPAEFRLKRPVVKGFRFQKAQKLIRRFDRIRNRVKLFLNSDAVIFFDNNKLSFTCDDRLHDIHFQKLIICEGAMERTIPFPGWTLPGIMTAGGLQKFLLNQHLLPGRRVLLSGTGPLLISVAASLAKSGAKVVALCDSTPTFNSLRLVPQLFCRKGLLRETLSYVAPLLAKRVSLLSPYAVISASGRDHVETATIARLNPDGKPLAGTERQVAVDLIGLNHGFIPLSRLTRLAGCQQVFDLQKSYWKPTTDPFMRTSLPDIYAAGDGSGIGGADMAEIEGEIAALQAGYSLKYISQNERDQRLKSLFKAKKKLQKYIETLFKIYAFRPGLFSTIDRNTVVCRCEGVSAGQIWDEIECGANSLAELKRIRLAMGLCQGRLCESIANELLKQKGIEISDQGRLHLRPPLSPLPISALVKSAEV